MGGVSVGTLEHTVIDGRPARHLTGTVSLENNGGFIQMALDLAPGGQLLDAGAYAGVAITVSGNGEEYCVNLRSADCARPWESYRAAFTAVPEWRTVTLPFAEFLPHRLAAPLDPARLRRIGIIAIGRAFAADVAVAELRLTA
ncbi:MAG: hypothetical protein HKO62_09420 [Gammaproteobacteria bacterium]|nr:hypothetical protein [Gammaproteobacteria bacterium]